MKRNTRFPNMTMRYYVKVKVCRSRIVRGWKVENFLKQKREVEK